MCLIDNRLVLRAPGFRNKGESYKGSGISSGSAGRFSSCDKPQQLSQHAERNGPTGSGVCGRGLQKHGWTDEVSKQSGGKFYKLQKQTSGGSDRDSQPGSRP